MSVAACAGLVERGDAERFQAVMAASPAKRGGLFVLYAFNLEVARAPWVTKEPMIADMRLQWWADVVGEATPRAHEVAGPLHALIREVGLPVRVFEALIEARRWDVYKEPFADAAAFDAYLDATAGGLMWLGALTYGAGPAAEPAVRAYAWAAGLASYLRAVPELEARGRWPLVDGRSGAVRDLAVEGLARLALARKQRGLVGPAREAMLAGWQAEALLKQVVADPSVVIEGRMGLSEFTRRGGLLWQGISGRW